MRTEVIFMLPNKTTPKMTYDVIFVDHVIIWEWRYLNPTHHGGGTKRPPLFFEFEYLLLLNTFEAEILRLLIYGDFGSILTIFMFIESDFQNFRGYFRIKWTNFCYHTVFVLSWVTAHHVPPLFFLSIFVQGRVISMWYSLI